MTTATLSTSAAHADTRRRDWYAVGVAHLAPDASDADVVVQRLAARILARYLDQPDHPALRRAAHRLGA